MYLSVMVQLPGGQRTRARVILVLRERILNAPAASLVHPASDDAGSLCSSHRVVYPPGSMVPPWVTTSRLLAGNREVELKPTTFSSLLLLRDFLYFLFS